MRCFKYVFLLLKILLVDVFVVWKHGSTRWLMYCGCTALRRLKRRENTTWVRQVAWHILHVAIWHIQWRVRQATGSVTHTLKTYLTLSCSYFYPHQTPARYKTIQWLYFRGILSQGNGYAVRSTYPHSNLNIQSKWEYMPRLLNRSLGLTVRFLV
jgi:hypothetical protein